MLDIEAFWKVVDFVDWGRVSREPNLTEEFIREFAERVDWYWISKKQTLSEDLIREFADRVHWVWIFRNQKLSENFIGEFAGRVGWYWILKYHQISEEFILQHLSYFLEDKDIWEDLPRWCKRKDWNYQRLTEAREMLRLLA